MNREVPHLLMLPEDSANRQIVNGFLDDPAVDARRIKVMREAGGWREALNQFEIDFKRSLERNPNAFLVLVIDFDGREDRITEAATRVPEDLKGRVFIVGALHNPEDLRKRFRAEYSLASFEQIGRALAHDCQRDESLVWNDELLKHNSEELRRLQNAVSKFVFRN